MATSGGADSGSSVEGHVLPEGEEGLLRLVGRSLQDLEDRLCQHVEESLRQLAQRGEAEREAQAAAMAEVQRELASQREGTQGFFVEVRRELGTVEEVVYSKCRDLSRQLAAVHAEQAQSLEKAKAVVDGAEESLMGQLKHYIDQLRGEMEAAAAGRNAEAMSASPGSRAETEERSAELRALLEEERGRREAEGAALLARLEALEASSAGLDAAAAEERMAAEAQLTALCARLETISREVTARAPAAAPPPPPPPPPGLSEAEAQALLARLEAVEASCRDVAAGPSAGSFAALRDRFEAIERQVSSLAATPRPAPAPASPGPATGREAEAAGAPANAERALAAKLASLERDQGVGAATSALSCGLARCIGEFDAELRVELREKIDGLREELRAEVQNEAKFDQLASELEAKLKQMGSEVEAKINQSSNDTEAKINQVTIDIEAKMNQVKLDIEAKIGHKEGDAEAGSDLGQRVAALEGEARRTSYLITRCIGELSGSRICGSDSAATGGKDSHRNGVAETATTTASTPTAVPGSASPGSVRAPPTFSSEDLGASVGRGASSAGSHGRDGGLGQSAKQLSDVSTDEGHGWETPAASPPQRLAAEIQGAGTPGRPAAARGLTASAPSHSTGHQVSAATEPPLHRRGDGTSIHTLPPGGGYARSGSPLPATPVDTTRGSVCSSDTVPVAAQQAVPARGLYGEARAALDEASHGHGPLQDEASVSGRRRVVVVPVSATGRSMSPELRRSGAARSQPRPAPAMQGLGSATSSDLSSIVGGFDALSSEERQRYLAEISSLRRENSSLREEVIDSREQALRQLRNNAERALRQQAGPSGGEAEGPVVSAANTPSVPAPPAPLRAGFQRSASPVPQAASARVQVMAQVSSRTATPARPGVALLSPGSPVAVETLTSRSAASPGPRRPGASLARVNSAGPREAEAWHLAEPAATARLAGPGVSPGLELRQPRTGR